jgi:hypothetical protein
MGTTGTDGSVSPGADGAAGSDARVADGGPQQDGTLLTTEGGDSDASNDDATDGSRIDATDDAYPGHVDAAYEIDAPSEVTDATRDGEPYDTSAEDSGFVVPADLDAHDDAAPGTDCSVDFESGSPGVTGDWQIDGLAGEYNGAAAIHPPSLSAGGTATMTITCATPHTQLSFWWYPNAANNYSASQLSLDFQVDGTHYRTLAGDGGGWRQIVVDVPYASHSYMFVVSTQVTVANAFVFDEFVMANNPPSPGVNGHVDFDEGFVPLELSNNGFLVDNFEGVQAGQAAMHAPSLVAGGSASTTFNCGDLPHTQFSFYWYPNDANNYSASQLSLDFQVDGAHYRTLAGDGGGWRQVVVDVPQGAHAYTFVVSSQVATQNAFLFDTFVCSNTTPTAGINGHVDFDEGFVPLELSNNGFLVDNFEGVQAGQAAMHAPSLVAGGSASTTFNCGDLPHTQFSFYWYPNDANNYSASQLSVDFQVDGVHYRTLAGDGGGWRQVVVDVPQGVHAYTFVVSSQVATQNAFLFDTFVCSNTTPTAGVNGHVDFDEGFIPLELSNNGFLVDNFLGIQAGQAAMHAPSLVAGGSASTTYTCGGATHTQLSFYWYPDDANNYSAAQLSVDFQVDGAHYRTLAGDGGGWRQVVVDVPQGSHAYKFVVSSQVATQNAFLFDTFVCANTTPTAAVNGHVDFDEGFVPLELSNNGFLVDNYLGVQAGQAAMHAPSLVAGGSASTTVNCTSSSQLSFYWYPDDANNYAANQLSVDLEIDGSHYATLAGDGGGWRQMTLSQVGTHAYTFVVSSQVATQNAFLFDTFVCN